VDLIEVVLLAGPLTYALQMGLTNHFDLHFFSLLTIFFEQVARSNGIVNQQAPVPRKKFLAALEQMW
jgi:hypothetical protein